jgi:ribosomal protein L32
MITPSQASSNLVKCPACGQHNVVYAKLCQYCGAPLEKSARKSANTAVQEMQDEPSPATLEEQRSPSAEAASLSKQCPKCGEMNRPGVLMCETCGANLNANAAIPLMTRTMENGRLHDYMPILNKPLLETLDVSPNLRQNIERGVGVFDPGMALRIEVEGFHVPLQLRIRAGQIVLGRRDATSSPVDVDLAPYSGYKKGVSRHHAVLIRQDRHLILWDLGSSNGTFLNGTRLEPHQRHQVRDGDEIGLGQMVLKLYFEQDDPV